MSEPDPPVSPDVPEPPDPDAVEEVEAETQAAVDVPGVGIVRASILGTALFTVVAVLGAIWPDVFGGPFLVISLAVIVLLDVIQRRVSARG